MWHGTRDGQTPQPVRMTLGNEGAFHPHSPALSVVVSRWLSLLCFGVSTGCRRKSYQHWISAVFHSSFFFLFWLVIAELHGPLGVSQAGWVSSSMLASKHRKAFGCKMTKYVLLATVCLLTPTEHPGCSYGIQFICRVEVKSHPLPPSVLHCFEWLPNSYLEHAVHLVPLWLSALIAAWHWSTAACHQRQNPSCGRTFPGGSAKEPCWVEWATSLQWNSGTDFTN